MDMVLDTVNRPAWRTLLETRWQQRLGRVTRLSLAYHDAAERLPGGRRAGDQGGPRELRRLMRETVAARRALSDTEEALARLSAGTYGRCEQCTAAIPVSQLAREPERRYCERCARQAAPAIVSISPPSPAHGACTPHR